MLASIYQRGLSFEEAQRHDEWMYVNFWNKKDKKINTLEALLEFQASYLLDGRPDAEITLLEAPINQRTGARTLVRRFRRKDWIGPEYTGFIDFEGFIFMCILLTSQQLERKNLRKLHFILREAFPMTVTRDNTRLIAEAKQRLEQSLPLEEKAALLSQIGWWYRDMDRLDDARQSLEQSLSLAPFQYESIKQLLAVLAKLGDNEAMLRLMSRFLRIDPANPTVFNDCITYAADTAIGKSDLVDLFDKLKTDHQNDAQVQAGCDFYVGSLLLESDPTSARKRLVDAQNVFQKVFPADHQVVKSLAATLANLLR